MTQYPDIRIRKLTATPKNDLFEVAEPCLVPIVGEQLTLIIPESFQTDFASVPQFLWSIVPPQGKMANAAILHDYMYDSRLWEAEMGSELARCFADSIFLHNMLRAGVPRLQAHLFYYAVRWFGKSWWVK